MIKYRKKFSETSWCFWTLRILQWMNEKLGTYHGAMLSFITWKHASVHHRNSNEGCTDTLNMQILPDRLHWTCNKRDYFQSFFLWLHNFQCRESPPFGFFQVESLREKTLVFWREMIINNKRWVTVSWRINSRSGELRFPSLTNEFRQLRFRAEARDDVLVFFRGDTMNNFNIGGNDNTANSLYSP